MLQEENGQLRLSVDSCEDNTESDLIVTIDEDIINMGIDTLIGIRPAIGFITYQKVYEVGQIVNKKMQSLNLAGHKKCKEYVEAVKETATDLFPTHAIDVEHLALEHYRRSSIRAAKQLVADKCGIKFE